MFYAISRKKSTAPRLEEITLRGWCCSSSSKERELGLCFAILRVQDALMGMRICPLEFISSSSQPGQSSIHFFSVAQAQEAGGKNKGSETQSHLAVVHSPGKHAGWKSNKPKLEIPRQLVVFRNLCPKPDASHWALNLVSLQFKVPSSYL